MRPDVLSNRMKFRNEAGLRIEDKNPRSQTQFGNEMCVKFGNEMCVKFGNESVGKFGTRMKENLQLFHLFNKPILPLQVFGF